AWTPSILLRLENMKQKVKLKLTSSNCSRPMPLFKPAIMPSEHADSGADQSLGYGEVCQTEGCRGHACHCRRHDIRPGDTTGNGIDAGLAGVGGGCAVG